MATGRTTRRSCGRSPKLSRRDAARFLDPLQRVVDVLDDFVSRAVCAAKWFVKPIRCRNQTEALTERSLRAMADGAEGPLKIPIRAARHFVIDALEHAI